MEKKELKSKLLILLDEFDDVKTKFYKKVKAEGHKEEIAKDWWTKICSQANYSFAKSHSWPYSRLTYLTMYLKKYYPKLFFISLLNNTSRTKENTEGSNKMAAIIHSAKKDYTIPVLPPDINLSKRRFTAEGEKIRFGLDAIKDVGKAAEQIIQNQPYTDFNNFIEKLKGKHVNKRVIDALVFSGCFNSLEKDKNKIINYYYSRKKSKNMEQTSFLDQDDKDDKDTVKFNKLKLIEKEIEYINFSFEDTLDTKEYPTLSSVNINGERIRFSAYIDSWQEKTSKKSGKKYVYLKATDFGQNITVMIFGDRKDQFISRKPKKGMLIRVLANKPEGYGIHFVDDLRIV